MFKEFHEKQTNKRQRPINLSSRERCFEAPLLKDAISGEFSDDYYTPGKKEEKEEKSLGHVFPPSRPSLLAPRPGKAGNVWQGGNGKIFRQFGGYDGWLSGGLNG